MIRRTSIFHISLQLTCFHHTSPLNTQAHMASRRQLKMEWNAPECNSSSSKGGDSRLLKDCCTAWLPSFFKSCVVCHHQHRHHRGIHRRSRAWWHFRKPLVLIRFRWSIEERSRRSGYPSPAAVAASGLKLDAKPEYVKAFCGFCQKHFAVSDCDHSMVVLSC